MGETAETLRNYHHASKKSGELSHLDPESYLKLPPIMTVKPRLSRLPFMLYKPWRKVWDRIQKIADTPPEPVSLRQSRKTPC
jgi:hypothetical protein